MHIIDAARPEDIRPALELVFGHLSEDERSARVANAESLIEAGDVEAEGILVARSNDALLGAIVAVALPGAGGIIWLPGVMPGREQANLHEQLVARACAWLKTKGAKVVQALVAASELPRAASLLSCEFTHVTQLAYLRHELGEIPAALSPAGLTFSVHTASLDKVFRQTLLATYEDTLDCPELNGARTIDEIMEGLRAQGETNPPNWWLMTRFGQPVGVLVVCRLPDTEVWDLSYVGVVRTARGDGVGRAAVIRALQEAQLAGAAHFSVAVDVRNTPARQLYQQLGFEYTGSREVFLRFLKS